MRKLILHLLVALVTFSLGTAASLFLGGLLFPSAEKAETPTIIVRRELVEAPARTERFGDPVSVHGVEVPKAPIIGGILNAKAIDLPQPIYPSIARAAHASGTVTVQVLVDESGDVISVRAVGGHPLLQQAAVEAAYGARFKPTRLDGQPVQITGVITYNFAAE